MYKAYEEMVDDLDYELTLINNQERGGSYHDKFRHSDHIALVKEWEKYMIEKYSETVNGTSKLSRFLKKHPLSFSEIRILLSLLNSGFLDFRPMSNQSLFRKNKVHYDRSQLKKQKLVFKIKDPRKPLEEEFVVSYRCQLGLAGKEYTEEYQQLDLELEDRSSRKGFDLMDTLYYTVKPKQKISDLVVDDAVRRKLEVAITRARNHDRISDHWKLGKIGYGTGITINFRGPPGTGKSMGAHCLANELGKELLIVRYDQIQSMWVGETEKHIQQVFKLAKIRNAVLFFDEADALAHDRSTLTNSWEMSQVNTLIKELERYEGICIFATNFAEKYDKAFERRLTIHIDFPMPKKEEAAKILHHLLPPRMRAKDVDLKNLPLENLSGGLLKNVMLNAIGFATQEGKTKIEQEHLQEAITMVTAKDQGAKDAIGYVG